MTATDELRRLLDERGVEWTNPNSCLRDDMTSWVANGFDYDAFEVPDGTLVLSAAHQDDLTPEQAIAATLGAEDAYTREDVESAFVSGYSLGCLPVGSDPTWDQNEQTVDEYMAEWGWVRKEATLGSGTCRYELRDGRFVCSNCGRSTWAFEGKGDTLDPPNFCPNCGRKVIGG